MVEENISQEFRLENIDQTRDYFVEEIERTELMRRKHKNVCTTLNCIEDFLISASTSTERISISAFAWYSHRNYKFCNKSKNLCNSCRN